MEAPEEEERSRSERLLKGLQEAKTRVDQVHVEDAKHPDLYDQLTTQAEPQNYFFEPYATQWCPQVVKKGSVIPLPSVVGNALGDAQTLTLSGLLPALDAAWTSIDTKFYLWSYRDRSRFASFQFDQAVVSAALCLRPKPGVFTDKVQHVIAVATTVEVVLLALVFDGDDPEKGNFKLQRTKLSVSTDDCLVRRLLPTRNGRIFFGGSDGGLYELQYGSDASIKGAGYITSLLPLSFLHKPCRKVAHTSTYANYLPSFLMALAGAPGKLRDFALDDTRQILYALHESGQVTVFDLGVDGMQTKTVGSLDLLAASAKYARQNRRTHVSCPDERLFQNGSMQVVSLAVIPTDESAFVTLVATTSNSLRLYMTVYARHAYSMGSSIPITVRPSRIEVVHVRLPPPSIQLADAPPYHSKEGMQPGVAPGKTPSNVHVTFHRHGVFLVVDGRKDDEDQLVEIAHDPVASTSVASTRKTAIRESVSTDSCAGKVVDIQELPITFHRASFAASIGPVTGKKRNFDEMSSTATTSGESVEILGEMARQFYEPSRHFLCLTHAGIQLMKKVRPIDQLHRTLVESRGGNLRVTLAPFVRSFGEIQVVSMLLGLACGVSSDPLTNEAATASLIHRRGGFKSDEYIFAAAVQGIFECCQGPSTTSEQPTQTHEADASSTRIVLTTELGMSYQHDGLLVFVSRVLRPLWRPKTVGIKTPAGVFAPRQSADDLDETREVLYQLRQLLERSGPYAVAIGNASMNDQSHMEGVHDSNGVSRVAQLTMKHQQSRSEDQLRRELRAKSEQQSLFCIYRLVLRSIEAISLLRLSMQYSVPLDESLANLAFGDFVASNDGSMACKGMVKALMKGREENNEYLVKQLREQCPSYFSVSDLYHYQGYKSLANAKLSNAGQRLTLAQESLTQFLNSCHMWDSEDCVPVLQSICEDYAMLQFYEGVVKLSLACAKNFDKGEDLSGGKVTWKRNCFGVILLALQRLLSGEASVRQSPQTVDELVRLDDETKERCISDVFLYSLASDDQDFHELLYTWLYENNHHERLVNLDSTHVEEFLKAKDQDLLIRLYMRQRKYLEAAKVWWARGIADSVNGSPDLPKRQYYLTKSLGCLKSLEETGKVADALNAVRGALELLQLQMRVLQSLEQSTSDLQAAGGSPDDIRSRQEDLKRLMLEQVDASALYNEFAYRYDMWSECLHIIHSCQSEEEDVVHTLWRKIIFSTVPGSTNSSAFNAWRTEQCGLAGISTDYAGTSSFEGGVWIGQLQSKLLHLGKALLSDAFDRHSASNSSTPGVVFPVSFLAKELEHISSWYLKLSDLPSFASPTSSLDSAMFNWVLKLFLDVGVAHRDLLNYYEQIYREQGSVQWTLHLLRSIYTILIQWKKFASSPRAGKDSLDDFVACCPHMVNLCDDFIIDLQALPQDDGTLTSNLLDQYRRFKKELLHLGRSM